MSLRTAFSAGVRALNFREAGREFFRGLGVSGTQMYSGQISDEDYGQRGRLTKMGDWDDPDARADMVDEMITDSTVEQVRNAIELPIKTAPLSIEPVGGKQAKNIDKQIADALEEDLLRNPNFNIIEFMRHWLTALWYGNVVMVKTFERVNGRTRWRGWHYRKQRTLDMWHISDMGDLLRVHQRAITPSSQHVDVWIPEKAPTSPMENPLFHFSYKQLGDNFNGVSLLRQAWRPYFIKANHITNLAKQGEIAAIAVPHIKWKNGIPDSGTTERTAAQNAASNLHGLARNYLESSETDFEIDAFGGADRFGFDLIPGIKLLNQEIVSSVLASFLEQPKSSTGSYAMQNVNMNMFLDSLEGLSNEMEVVFNEGWRGTQHVKQYVNMNWPNVTEYPKLRIAQINTMNLETLMTAVKSYVESGFPVKDEDINAVRERMGWTAMEEKEFKEELERMRKPKEEEVPV